MKDIEGLIKLYDNCGTAAKRQIILAATVANATEWLRLLKSDCSNLEPWLRRAIIYSAQTFPKDEKKFWLGNIKKSADDLERAIITTIK